MNWPVKRKGGWPRSHFSYSNTDEGDHLRGHYYNDRSFDCNKGLVKPILRGM
jgi:hypothetical protein